MSEASDIARQIRELQSRLDRHKRNIDRHTKLLAISGLTSCILGIAIIISVTV